jgi:AcrR family transcriptional regulator
VPAVERRRYQKRLKPSDRREAILDAALSVVLATGDLRATMAAVAAAGGVTKPVVYDYFANSEQLMMALLAREGARAMQVLEAVLPDPGALPEVEDRAEWLVARFEQFLRAVEEEPAPWRLTLMPPEGAFPEVRERVDLAREAVRQRIVALLQWGLPAGGAGLDLDLLSHAVHAVVQRFARLVILEPEGHVPERAAAFLRSLLAAIAS